MRTPLFTAILALGLTIQASAAISHHGWSWTTGEKMEFTGVIREVRLGNPHGILKVEVDGKLWTIEVGQPWCQPGQRPAMRLRLGRRQARQRLRAFWRENTSSAKSLFI
jgi:hypothetical protein